MAEPRVHPAGPPTCTARDQPVCARTQRSRTVPPSAGRVSGVLAQRGGHLRVGTSARPDGAEGCARPRSSWCSFAQPRTPRGRAAGRVARPADPERPGGWRCRAGGAATRRAGLGVLVARDSASRRACTSPAAARRAVRSRAGRGAVPASGSRSVRGLIGVHDRLGDATAVADLVTVGARPIADRGRLVAVAPRGLVRHRGLSNRASAGTGLSCCPDVRREGVTQLGGVLVGQVDLVLAAVDCEVEGTRRVRRTYSEVM